MSEFRVIHDIAVPALSGEDEHAQLVAAVSKKLSLQPNDFLSLHVIKRALDTRQKQPKWVYSARIEMPGDLAARLSDKWVKPWPLIRRRRWSLNGKHAPPVVVGAGPAGLFAALTLSEAGLPPVIIERGEPVEQRAKSVSRLYRSGDLNPESNVCFGEGGAGTFSDGKLYTRISDGRVRDVYQHLVVHGARPSILVDARPHVGTDRLVVILKSLRSYLQGLGAQFRFGESLLKFATKGDRLQGVQTNAGQVPCKQLVLATGHSGREVYELLSDLGVPLEARPFAMGFRVEHPQALINELRYRSSTDQLPAADYRLAYNEGDHGVYSFCMCPGGVVVPTPTQPDGLCINGMSYSARSGRFANSAVVTTVTPKDYGAGQVTWRDGLLLQEQIEVAAAKMGGGGFTAPAARLDAFVSGKMRDVGSTSYRRGIVAQDLQPLFPEGITQRLVRGLKAFEERMKGFVTNEAHVIGVETRTASPVRVPRSTAGEISELPGIFPAGEGMGYGGGIVSAAVDGVRAAEALLVMLGAQCEEFETHF